MNTVAKQTAPDTFIGHICFLAMGQDVTTYNGHDGELNEVIIKAIFDDNESLTVKRHTPGKRGNTTLGPISKKSDQYAIRRDSLGSNSMQGDATPALRLEALQTEIFRMAKKQLCHPMEITWEFLPKTVRGWLIDELNTLVQRRTSAFKKAQAETLALATAIKEKEEAKAKTGVISFIS